MTRTKWISLFAIILLVGSLTAAASLWFYYSDLPNHLAQHETLVVGQNRFTPGSTGAVRVVVRDTASGAPLAGAQINVSLRDKSGASQALYQGQTDGQGSANVSFKVPIPSSSEQTLVIETRSSLGSDSVERPVTVQRNYRVLLTTDKPIYQPGQVIHLRSLALSSFDLQPAQSQPLEVTIADGKGNKVFRQTLTTSAYGVASADFELASEVNSGAYKITAQLGNSLSEKTVTVENYTLPKFGVKLEPEKTFYLPGEHVRGMLSANYFYGKPVAASPVLLEGYTFDVQRSVAVKIEGKTDPQGNYAFEFDLPKYLTGSKLEKGSGRFYLQASVTDQTQHTEQVDTSLPVARSPLVIDAVPEGGYLMTNVENILYVLVSYPDGSPVAADLKLTFLNEGSQVTQVATGPYGVAEVRRTPRNPMQTVNIEARDKKGNVSFKQFVFQSQYGEETVLLRPDKPVYQVGEAMKLTLLTSGPTGTLYLDLVRQGQVVSTRAVEVNGGKAELVVDLTPDLYGSLELHAYKLLRSGATVRDTRMVVVDQAEGLKIALTPGQDTYKPGDAGQLNVSVTGADGKGAQAALGLAVVDESVFALAQQDPGFAQLYFMLEKQLLEPKYDLHGYSLPDLMGGKALPESDPLLGAAVGQAAQASLAEAVKKTYTFSLQANSHQDNLTKANQLRAQFFETAAQVFTAGLAVLALAMLLLVGFNLAQRKLLGRSLLLLVVILLVVTGLLALFYLWATQSPNASDEARLGLLILAGLLALFCLASLIGLVVIAIRRKELGLSWQVGLAAVFSGMILSLFIKANQTFTPANDGIWLWLLVGSVTLMPLTFWLRSAGFIWLRQTWAALAAFGTGLLLLTAVILPALLMPSRGQTFTNVGLPIEDMAMERGIAPPMPLAAPQAAGAARETTKSNGPAAVTDAATPATEPPRLRQYFPETMLWLPETITDASGTLKLDVPVADSITTWRITALASTQDGRLGSASGALRVFQDFFVDLDLPATLTVGDEVAVPVGVFNYLPGEQTVRLELTQADWFELKDEPVKQIKIAANEISVVYFRIQAKTFGRQPFQVTALGSKMSDAIKKEVTVYPDGKQIRSTLSDQLASGATVSVPVSIPADSIAGTQKIWVKLYPGMLSQVVDGLDGMLRMPSGCFEQTSSTTYPNVLVLDYLKTTQKTSPEVQLKAEQYINLGYQRLTTFEVKSSGGFSLFGNEPADRMLTAYGLQEFSDMSRVHTVDPALLQRAAKWLITQQEGDGSWKNDRGLVHESTWQSLGNDRLPVTAYISWSLVEAGFGEDAATKKGLDYVREYQAQTKDSYVLALVANALVSADLKNGKTLTPATEDALTRLAALAKRDGDKAYWQSSVAGFMGSQGLTGSIETTALAALALQRAERSPDLANGALAYLIQQKDSFGSWHNTQATVLALKALIQSVRGSGEKINASVTVTLNGGQSRVITVTPQNFDVVQLISFEDVNPRQDNRVELKSTGQGNLMYQVAASYYLPWDLLGRYPDVAPAQDAVVIDVKYDRTQIAVNDTVGVSVTVRLNQKGARAESALVDLGLPPGFTVQAEDLAALVQQSQKQPKSYQGAGIQRYELTGRQILIYLTNLSEGQPLTFTYRLRARFPLSVRSPASSVYDYYNPAISGEKAPQALEVKP